MAEGRVSPYSLNDLKNTTDDALGNYLRGLNFTQDNSKLDFRLGVGYASVIIAAVTFVADYKLGWEATKYWTAAAVAAYAVLSAIFNYWMWAVEKGLVFEGSKDGKKITLSSKTKKHDPTYYLTVTTAPASPSSTSSPAIWIIKAPFTTWFTSDGYFVAQPFQKWLASSVKIVGDADTKNAPVEKASIGAEGNGVPATPVATSSGNDTKGTSSSKKSRKKA